MKSSYFCTELSKHGIIWNMQKVKFCSKSETSRVIRYEEYLALLTFLFLFLGQFFKYFFNTNVSTDAGIEPRTAVVYAWTVIAANH